MRKVIRSFENNSVSEDATCVYQISASHKVQIFIARITRCGQDFFFGRDAICRESRSFGQLQPFLHSARVHFVPIMIDNSLPPSYPKRPVVAFRENDRIFTGMML
jgi:hypothetical protein